MGAFVFSYLEQGMKLKPEIDSVESISGFLKRLKIRALERRNSTQKKIQSIQSAFTPFPQGSVALSPFGSKGDTLVCGRGSGGPNSDDGTDTLVL